jgi:tetratricopeptide (TPR) repeat protein
MRQSCGQAKRTGVCVLTALFCLPVAGWGQDAPATFDLNEANENSADFFSNGRNDQTTVTATRALWTARVNYGEESIEAALAQIKVANAQQKSADHPAAVDSFEQSIRRIEAVEGIVSPKLVSPLMGLAASLNTLGAFDRGLITYQRALRLNHVDNGLYNEQQLPIRDRLTETYMALGEQDDAEFQQEIQVVILQQEYGNNPDKVIPAMYKLAGWYQRTNQPQKQAYQYQTAVRMIREQADKDSPNQIEALRELSKIYFRMNMPAESMRTLKRAYRLNAEASEPDPVLAADIEIQIGDFYSLFGNRNNARQYYKNAWNRLDALGGKEELLDNYFGRPVMLEGPAFPDVYPMNSSTAEMLVQQPERFREGYVMAEFNVEANGRVRDIRIIESAPAALIDKRVRIVLARQRYRPRFVAGEPIASNGERFRHPFNYAQQHDQNDDDKAGERLTRPGLLERTP